MAIDTYSADGVGVILMGTGNDNNNWGQLLNNAGLQVLVDAITNVLTSTVTGGTLDLSGSPPPAAPSQVHHESLTFTGTLTANQVVKVPNLAKRWRVNNTCTLDGFTLSLQTPNGSGSVQTVGAIAGGSGYASGSYANVPLTGGSGTGATANITVSGDAVTAVTLVIKGQKYLVADILSASASAIGGTGSGFSVPVSVVANVIPAGSWDVRCDGSNNIMVSPYGGNQIQMPDGSASAPAYSDVNETNLGWYRNQPQDWRLAINGSDVLQVTGAGAAIPGVMNLLAGALQVGGVEYIPAGAIMEYGGVLAPTGWYLCCGQAIPRSGDANLLAAITLVTTASTHSSTALDTIAGQTLETLSAMIGAVVEGTGIPSGTTVAGVNSASSVTLSQAATSTGSGVALRFFPYGNGDGSTTFNIPDHRERVIAGRGGMGGGPDPGRLTTTSMSNPLALGAAGGIETVALSASQIPGHTHGYSGSGTTGTENQSHTHTLSVAAYAASGGGQVSGNAFAFGNTVSTMSTESAAHNHNFSWSGITDAGSGGGAAHNNVQPTVMATKIIKR